MARRPGDSGSRPDFELVERIRIYKKKIIRECQGINYNSTDDKEKERFSKHKESIIRDRKEVSHNKNAGDENKEIETDGGYAIKIPTLANLGLVTLGIGSFGFGSYLVTVGDIKFGATFIIAGLTSLLTGLKGLRFEIEVKLKSLREDRRN